MISGEELKYLNGLVGLRGLGMGEPYPHRLTFQSGAFALTMPPNPLSQFALTVPAEILTLKTDHFLEVRSYYRDAYAS